MELKDLKELLDQEEEKDTFDLHAIFQTLKKRWLYFAISIPICLLIAGIYSLTITPVYKISSTILIKSKDNNSLKGKASFLDGMDMFGGKDNVLDEIQVINSKSLTRRVVNDLDLQVVYFLKKNLKEIELYKNSPIKASMIQENLDTLRAPIELNIKHYDNQYLIEGICDDGLLKKYEFSESTNSFPTIIQTPMGMIHLTRNSEIVMPTNPIKVMIYNTYESAAYLKKELTIELADKKANAINISLATKNILKGQDVINKLIEIYNISSVDEKNQTAINSIKFIDDRLSLLTGELTKVEKNVEDYKQTNKLTDIQAESEEFIKQNSDFEKQRLANETQINVISFIEKYIKDPENKFGVVPNLGIKDDDLGNVLQGYNELIFKRERLKSSTSDNNPALIDIERQILAMRKAIIASIESNKKGLLIAKQDMDRQDAALTTRIKAVPKQEREFLEIKRQQIIKAELYTFLLQKREENNLTLAIGIPSARVIEEALPEDKLVSKGKSFYLAIAFLIGLILPLIYIFLHSQLRGQLANKQELESLTKVTILGEIPEYKGKDPIVVRAGSHEPIVEMYRLLRSNLKFVLHDRSMKVINITSTQSGEGKTTFALNLAISLSLTNKKTLLVGLDIRKPTIREYINIPGVEGITSYLSGIEKNIELLIHKTSIDENLYVLPSGSIPPNPNELLLKDELDELFNELRNRFDYIIVDTAPVGMVSDSYLLDRITDANIYIIRANYSDKQNINIINEAHSRGKLKNMYLVMKGSDIKVGKYIYKNKKH